MKLTIFLLIDGNKYLIFKGKPQHCSKNSEIITLKVDSSNYRLIPFEDANYTCEVIGCQEPKANKEGQYCGGCQADMAEMLMGATWGR